MKRKITRKYVKYIDYRGYIFKLYFYYMPRNSRGFAETRCSIYQISEKKHWWDKNERFLPENSIKNTRAGARTQLGGIL